MIILLFSEAMAKTNFTEAEIFGISFGTIAGGMALVMIIIVFIVLLMYFKRRKSSSCAAVELDNSTRYVMMNL